MTTEIKKLKSILENEGYSHNSIIAYLNQAKHLLHGNTNHCSKSTWQLRRVVEKKMLDNSLLTKAIMPEKNISKVNREAYIVKKVLEDDQIQMILDDTKRSDYRLAIELSLCTGLRFAEIMDLNPGDIKLGEHPFINVLNGKGNKFRKAYIINPSPGLEEELKQFQGFAFKRSSLKAHLHRLSKKIGFDFSMHSFRHTFATRLVEDGVRLEIIQRLLGHSFMDTTLIYAKITQKSIENELFGN